MRSSTPIITAETTKVRWMMTYHINVFSRAFVDARSGVCHEGAQQMNR